MPGVTAMMSPGSSTRKCMDETPPGPFSVTSTVSMGVPQVGAVVVPLMTS